MKRHYYELFVRLFHSKTEWDPWGLAEISDLDARDAVIRAATTANGEIEENLIHWHVFDFDVLAEAVEGCLGYEILLLQLMPPGDGTPCPWHQVLLARKPPD